MPRKPYSLILYAAIWLCAVLCARAAEGPEELAPPPPDPHPQIGQVTLKQAAPLTSAGVYDAQGHLVRVLWTMQPLTAGTHPVAWDGRDVAGDAAPDGPYTFKLTINRSTYTNLGTIGNTGRPPNSFAHVPINFEAVAVGHDGAIYTVHDWDEPHNDVIRWSPETGQVVSHAGHPISGMMKALAVDEQYAYFTAYNDVEKRATAKFTIGRLRIDPRPNVANWSLVPFTKAGKVIVVYHGDAVLPPNMPDADRSALTYPLLSLAVHGDTLYATDALAGKVRLYDKDTGEQTGALDVPLPQAVAIAPDGRVWVGHEHHRVSVFSATGERATPITDLTEVNALAFAPDGTLYVADQGAAQVRRYAITSTTATLRGTLGEPAQPGDRAAARFIHLHGLAVDAQGNIITAQNEFFFNGGRLAKFTPAGKPLWEQLGLEFASNGAYAADDPDTVYSCMFHTYHVDRKDGSWQYLGNSYARNTYRAGPSSPPRVFTIEGRRFFYLPSGDGVQIYRIEPPKDATQAPVLRLASILGQALPLPDGTNAAEAWRHDNAYLWSWHDVKGDHTPHAEDIVYASTPKDNKPLWQHGPMTIDAERNIWFTSYDRGGETPERNSVWMIPCDGLDARGNPIYDWKHATCVLPRSALDWQSGVKMVQHAVDGYTYLYGSTRRKGTPQSGGAWMGGNTLAGFKGTERMWQVILPDVCVGLDVIPGGHSGCLVGGVPVKGVIHHYSQDGLLIGTVGPAPEKMGASPNNPSGFLDMYAAVSVCRDPRDGLLDVFVEDDYNLRIAWYRIDDRQIETLTGPMLPAAVRNTP